MNCQYCNQLLVKIYAEESPLYCIPCNTRFFLEDDELLCIEFPFGYSFDPITSKQLIHIPNRGCIALELESSKTSAYIYEGVMPHCIYSVPSILDLNPQSAKALYNKLINLKSFL